MANTATKISATPNRLTYRLNGDGTVLGPTIPNATILADMVKGPLRDAWNKTYANQAAMRDALLGRGQGCSISIQLAATPVQTTAEQNLVTADVDVDAVTATKAELNIAMSDTTGQIAYLHIEHDFSMVQ